MPSTIPTQPLVAFPIGSSPVLNTTSPVMDWGVNVATHMMIITGTGTLTTGAFLLQGSHDNVNWVGLGSATTAIDGTISTTVANSPVRYVRVNTSTAVTGGGSVTVTIASV